MEDPSGKTKIQLVKPRTHQSMTIPKMSTSPMNLPIIFGTEYSSKLHLFLLLLYSGTSVNVMIPPSYFEFKLAARAALYYHSEGELHMESEDNSLDNFFEHSKENDIRKYRQPKFIHFTKDNLFLYADEAEAKSNFEACRSEFSLIQKYIPSSTKYSKKLRVVWNREKGFSFRLVSNKNILPKSQ